MSKGQLAEPIEIAKFWKNRKGEAIIVRLTEYEGHPLIDARTWFTAPDGALKPGKGLACTVRHLPRLAAALNKALEQAQALGLLDERDSDTSSGEEER
jgi:Transcriptional Coactivator p15 (PC4)